MVTRYIRHLPFGYICTGIDWAAANRILPAVASLSLGGGVSEAENKAIENLVDSGVIVSVSAGNNNFDACLKSPASEPTVSQLCETF